LGEIIPGSLPAEEQRQSSYAVCHPWFDYFLKDNCDAWDDFQTALVTDPNLGTIDSECYNDAPVISENNGILESNIQVDYQWYLNGVALSGEDQQTHIYAQSGMYQVGTFLLGNCPTLSNEIIVQATGIVEHKIVLETTRNGTQIRSRHRLNNVTLEWYDVSGRVVSSERLAAIKSNKYVTIDKPIFNRIKLLRLSSNETVKTWKLY
jgi:hypothetical protein